MRDDGVEEEREVCGLLPVQRKSSEYSLRSWVNQVGCHVMGWIRKRRVKRRWHRESNPSRSDEK